MTDIINTPNTNSNSAAGWVLAIVAIIVVVLLLMYFVFPGRSAATAPVVTPADTGAQTTETMPAPVTNNNTIINATSTTVNSTTTAQ